MRLTGHSAIWGLFVYMIFVMFSESVFGMDNGAGEPVNYTDDWPFGEVQSLPVISFEDTALLDELTDDIRIENIVQDKDGSTRFQLSHIGPLSRQVFASVRRIPQDDGYTRTVMTNIADGQQEEYLTLTADLLPINQEGLLSAGELHGVMKSKAGQKTECLVCVAYLLYKAACARAETKAFQMCHDTCQRLGGIKHFDAGECAILSMECTCFIQPPREARDF